MSTQPNDTDHAIYFYSRHPISHAIIEKKLIEARGVNSLKVAAPWKLEVSAPS